MNWDAWWSGFCTLASIALLVLATMVAQVTSARILLCFFGVVVGIVAAGLSHDAVKAKGATNG